MAKRLKIIKEEQEKPRFSRRLEEKARVLTEEKDESWDPSPEDVIARDIALTLNHINGVRTLHEGLEQSLSRLQLYFDTKLMQLWPGKDEPLPYLWREQDKQKIREKEKLQERLLNLEEERRKLFTSLEEKLQPLHDRLLSLLHKHALLKFDVSKWKSKK